MLPVHSSYFQLLTVFCHNSLAPVEFLHNDDFNNACQTMNFFKGLNLSRGMPIRRPASWPMTWMSKATNMPKDDNSNKDWQQSLYEEIRPIAEAALRHESPGHLLQPTLLVNDAYLRIQRQRNLRGANRSEVLAAAAKIIRRLIVDDCRRRRAEKRGGAAKQVSLRSNTPGDPESLDLIELNDALELLQEQHPRAAQVVELRFFGGLSAQEVAEHLNVSLSTVNSDWRFSKAWLFRTLRH